MLKDILELEDAQELSKNQQKAVNGGKKCQTLSVSNEIFEDGTDSPPMPQTCNIRCRPSFLGIGLGSWTYATVGCSNQPVSNSFTVSAN